jgi:hypothetical protein
MLPLLPLQPTSCTNEIQDFLKKAWKHYQSTALHCQLFTIPIGFENNKTKRNISNVDDIEGLATFSYWTRQKQHHATTQLAFLCTPPPYVGRTEEAWSQEQWHAWGAVIIQCKQKRRTLVIWDSNAEAAYLPAAPTKESSVSTKQLPRIQRALIQHVRGSMRVKEAYVQGSGNDAGGRCMLLTGNWLEDVLAGKINYLVDEKGWHEGEHGFIRKLKW